MFFDVSNKLESPGGKRNYCQFISHNNINFLYDEGLLSLSKAYVPIAAINTIR
jgi:hypothetical protein